MFTLSVKDILLFSSILVCDTKSKLLFKNYNTNFNEPNFSLNSDFGYQSNFSEFYSTTPFYTSNLTFYFSAPSKLNFTFWLVCQRTFIKYYDYVSIVSIDNEFLDFTVTYDEFGPIEWHTTVGTFTSSNAVIVIVKTAGALHSLLEMKSSLWNQKSIYVITILECSEDIKLEMTTLWQYYRLYKYVLICSISNPVLYIYQPFVPTEENRIVEVIDFADIVENILHGIDNLYGSSMRIVFFPRIPTAVARKGKYVGGADYNALITLRDKMNFSSIIFRPTDGYTFTEAGKNISGSIRDIAIGNADIAFNGHFLQDYQLSEILLTRQMYMDKLCFIVAMPSFKSHYAVILHIFSPTVWGLLVIMHFTTVILYYLIQSISKTEKRTYNLQELFFLMCELVIFGASTINSDITSKKFLVGGVLITVLILNNTFQGSLVTVLSRPIRNPFIDTLEQVIQSNVALQSQRAESFVSDPELVQLLNTLRKRKLHTQNYIWVGRFPIMKLRDYRNYLNYRGNKTEYCHAVPECIMSNFLVYVVPRNSPFLGRINFYLLKFQEAGLIGKWFGVEMDDLLRYTYWPIENEQLTETQSKIFTIADLAFVFTLLLFGLALSTAVFFIEKVVGKTKKKKLPKTI